MNGLESFGSVFVRLKRFAKGDLFPWQFIFLGLTVLLPSSYSCAKGVDAPLSARLDRSAEYRAEFQGIHQSGFTKSATAAVANELRKYKIVFIKGYFSDYAEKAGMNPPFEVQRNLLAKLGVSSSMVSMNSTAPVRENARIISNRIAEEDAPLVIIAHSKGAIDLLSALSLDPSLIGRIRGILILQSPLYGSLVADTVVRGTFPLSLGLYDTPLPDRIEAFMDLTTVARSQFFKQNKQLLGSLLEGVPILSVATWTDLSSGRFKTAYTAMASYFSAERTFENDAFNVNNDGSHIVSNGILRGSEYVVIPGVDHVALVHGQRNGPENRAFQVESTLSLLKMLADRMR